MKAAFIFADDVQILQNGKPIIIGAYLDSVLIVQMPTEARRQLTKAAPGVVPLCFVITVIDGEPGEYTCQVEFNQPDGTSVFKTDASPIKVSEKRSSHNLLFRFGGFPFWEEGTHTVRVIVDSETIMTGTFDLRIEEDNATAATTPQ